MQTSAERNAIQNEPIESKVFRILIVEDDKAFWPFWKRVFSGRPDVQIDWTPRLSEAEKLVRMRFRKQHPYDLVISDVFLEDDGTGIELWNKYGEEAKNFIFVSGMSLSAYDLLMALNHGYPVYLRKPLSIESCREIVDSCLGYAEGGGDGVQ